ncbi:MAG: hypothetical protein AAGF72_07755 [Pseudomonadota bacterium]
MAQRLFSYRILTCSIAFLYSAVVCGAEFLETDVEPTVVSVLLTEYAVAVEIEHNYFPRASEDSRKFFVAQRPDYEFNSISGEQYLELRQFDHYVRHTDPYRGEGYKAPIWWVSGPLCAEDSDPREGRTPVFGFGESTVGVKLDCDSYVSDVSFLNGEVWITTYLSTDYFDASSEGLIVASMLDGQVKSRIDLGEAAARAIVRDPWSSDIWVLTDRRISVMAEDRTIKAWREPVHGFDDTSGRPDVMLPSETLATNPLAVIAYGLGEGHYRKFYQAIAGASFVPEEGLLGRYFDESWNHVPQLPPELVPLLNDAEPTNSWRKLACMLQGERARKLCVSPLEAWPEPTGHN